MSQKPTSERRTVFRDAATGTGDIGPSRMQLYMDGDKLMAQKHGGAAVLVADLASGSTTPVGAVNAFAGTATAPAGWLLCNGNAVTNGSGTVQGQTADFSDLYALVSTTYGAEGTLPDLAGRVIAQEDVGTYNRGVAGGAASVALVAANVPTHDHTVSDDFAASVTNGSYGNPYAMNCEPDTYASKPYKYVNMYGSCTTTNQTYQRHASHAKSYSDSFSVSITGSASVDEKYGNGSGGVDGVDVRQPTLYMNYIIKF